MRPAAFRVRYEQELNPEQRAVVEAAGGPMLVISGAGSGKTRTITYRVARLIETGVAPSRILLVTFTNKAAREMLHRVELLCGQVVRSTSGGLWGGTFHHIGNRILRRYAPLLGYTAGFSILDREDARELIETCVAEAGIETKGQRFPKGEVLSDMVSAAVNTQLPLEAVLLDRYAYFIHLTEEILTVAERYAGKKRALNVMDFDDLLAQWHRLLIEQPDIRDRYADRFLHILVDEYQDTNKLQAEIVDLLASGHRNLVVVGDDAQCIYSFRGSHFANIIEFPQRYPDAAVYKLETNYRSTPDVLALANSSIRHNQRQFPKVLQAVRRAGGRPFLIPCRDALHQAAVVADRILELQDEGRRLADVAVLYRSHYHSMELQMELTRRGIPFVVRSGLRFFEQAHIKDVAGYLKVIANPRDELAWKRILRHLPRVGRVTAERIWQYLSAAVTPLEALTHEELVQHMPRGVAVGWQAFVAVIEQLRQPAIEQTPGEAIRAALEGYRDYLYSRYPNAFERVQDIEQLALFASHYTSIKDFLAELTLLGTVESEAAVIGSDHVDDAVILSTVHQAKGLEWPAVIMIWLTDGRFPATRPLETPDGEEEERRLFYVGATRAKDELLLLYPLLSLTAGIYGRTTLLRPSRFVQELEPTTYERVIAEEDVAGLADRAWDWEV